MEKKKKEPYLPFEKELWFNTPISGESPNIETLDNPSIASNETTRIKFTVPIGEKENKRIASKVHIWLTNIALVMTIIFLIGSPYYWLAWFGCLCSFIVWVYNNKIAQSKKEIEENKDK